MIDFNSLEDLVKRYATLFKNKKLNNNTIQQLNINKMSKLKNIIIK